MLSLSEQYAIEAKRVDNVICQRVKEALQIGIREDGKVRLRSKDIEQLCRELENRKNAVLSLFEGDFPKNQSIIRDQMEMERFSKTRPRTSKYSQLANRLIRKRVDTALSEIIRADNCSAIEYGIGIDRKTFIDEILDGNVQIDLNRNKETETPEDHGDR